MRGVSIVKNSTAEESVWMLLVCNPAAMARISNLLFAAFWVKLMLLATQLILKIAIGLREAAPLSNAVAKGSLSKF